MPPPALILLHGACLNQANWNPVRRLLEPRWRVLPIDLPGHGSRRAERYSLEGAARVVAEAAGTLAPAPVVLVGDSLGGYSAMAAAAALPPGQLAGLVLGGCSQNMNGAALRALRRQVWLFRLLIPILGEQRLARSSARRLMRPAGHREEDIEAIVAAGMHLRAFEQAVDALAGVDFLPRLAKIPQPVLFLNGEQDLMPVAHEAEFVATAARGSSQRFACGHGVSLLKSSEFATVVTHFLERLGSEDRP